mgnify:CR=1 FL=1
MKKSILILDMEQVKSDLVEMWADMIVNDRALVRECIIGNRPLNGRNGVIARDRKSTRLNSSHMSESRMPSSA